MVIYGQQQNKLQIVICYTDINTQNQYIEMKPVSSNYPCQTKKPLRLWLAMLFFITIYETLKTKTIGTYRGTVPSSMIAFQANMNDTMQVRSSLSSIQDPSADSVPNLEIRLMLYREGDDLFKQADKQNQISYSFSNKSAQIFNVNISGKYYLKYNVISVTGKIQFSIDLYVNGVFVQNQQSIFISNGYLSSYQISFNEICVSQYSLQYFHEDNPIDIVIQVIKNNQIIKQVPVPATLNSMFFLISDVSHNDSLYIRINYNKTYKSYDKLSTFRIIYNKTMTNQYAFAYCCYNTGLQPLYEDSQSNEFRCVQNQNFQTILILYIIPTALSCVCGVITLFICCLCKKFRQNRQARDPNEAQFNEQDIPKSQFSQSMKDININEMISSQCSICMEFGCNTKISCGHYFHKTCILEWAIRKLNCPICRQRIDVSSFRILKH